MRKITQLELLEEGFLDLMRRAGGIARAAVKGAAKGIYAMDPSGFDTIAAPFKTIAAPITGALKQIKQDDPVSFLKEELKTNRSIELIKVVSQKTQNANTSKYKNKIKNLLGSSKTVTIINFWGTTYRSGTERRYQTYGEANELSIPGGRLSTRTRNNTTQLGPARNPREIRDARGRVVDRLSTRTRNNTTQLGPARNPREIRDARGRVVDVEAQEVPQNQQLRLGYTPEESNVEDSQPPVEGAKLMAAEVFRTSGGLVLGDVYDPKTGDIISEYKEKQQSFSFENAKANFFANQQTPISPNTTELSVQDATNLIKYLFQIKSKNYDTAQPAEKSGFEAILSNATAASAKVKVSDIKSVAKQTRIAENTHISQKVLLEQISRL